MTFNVYDDLPIKKISKQKEFILEALRGQGCRITKQRMLIIDIILNNEISSCKGIYSEVIKKDPTIGIATIYRMLKSLEDIGAIDRRNMYRMYNNEVEDMQGEYIVILKNKEVIKLSADTFSNILKKGLSLVGGIQECEIDSVILNK